MFIINEQVVLVLAFINHHHHLLLHLLIRLSFMHCLARVLPPNNNLQNGQHRCSMHIWISVPSLLRNASNCHSHLRGSRPKTRPGQKNQRLPASHCEYILYLAYFFYIMRWPPPSCRSTPPSFR